MTAIFTVWNNYGFALASDSNQTAAQKNQTWIDPVEKIIMLQNHQVALGAAGKSMFNGIEINEIIRSWEKLLPSAGYPMLEDYFVDFACWFALQEFSRSTTSHESYSSFCKSMFEIFRDDYAEELISGDTDEFLEAFFTNENLRRNKLNIFGDGWDDFANPDELNTDVENTNTMKRQLIEDLHIKIARGIHELKAYERNKICQHINQHPQFQTVIFPATLEIFNEVFGRPFEASSENDQLLVTLVFSKLENDLNFDLPIKFLMVGYGNNEWLPSGITFDAIESYYSVPRIRINDYSNPRYNWYLALAVDSAVDQLTRGHSRERAYEVLEMAKPHLKKGHEEQFDTNLQVIANEKFHSSLERLDYLTLERLEFVSRLFVQIEALKSFLDEPVPGVGGDTKVIAMTKSIRREKHFKELG